MGRRNVGLIMNDVFNDLSISLKGEKSVFNFPSDEDLKNLSAFFEGKHIPAAEILWKEEDPFRLYSIYCFRQGGNKERDGVQGQECDCGHIQQGCMMHS